MTDTKKTDVAETAPDTSFPRGELASADDAAAREAASKRANTPGPMEFTRRPATGNLRAAAQSHEELFDFVEVDSLKRDYTWGPAGNQKTYGPSSEPIEIPEPLATSLGLVGKRTSQQMTRREEHEAGIKSEKHPTAVGTQKNQNFSAIPVSDPRHEAPGQEERQAAHEAAGMTSEQLNEKQKAAEKSSAKSK